MSERLDELHRQRALLAQHAAWLDREIEREASRDPDSPADPGKSPASGLRLATAPSAIPPLSELPVVSPFLGSGPTSAMPEKRAISVSTTPSIANPNGAPMVPPEALLEEYRVAPENLRTDIRKGCFLYFAIALVLLGVGVMALWIAFRRE